MTPQSPQSRYVAFWEDTGAQFPSLKGAVSTDYYFDCERTLFEDYVPTLKDLLLMKTDLWDEAKNTEILRWAADQGARPFGLDISFSIARDARRVLHRHAPGVAVADVRAVPFASDTFDFVYSMGTIEHFDDTVRAAREIFRVLKPGGRAIIGVPNKLDPFLRPLLAGLMQLARRYPYGMEKSYTPWGLRRLLATVGFRVEATSGILFMPGLLRMLDLWWHTRSSPMARVSAWMVRPFAWAYRRFPAVRRHGYLIACIVTKPEAPSPMKEAP